MGYNGGRQAETYSDEGVEKVNLSGSTSISGTGKMVLASIVAAGGVWEGAAVLAGGSGNVGVGVGNKVGAEIGPAGRSTADAALGLQPPGKRAARVSKIATSFLPESLAAVMGKIPLALESRSDVDSGRLAQEANYLPERSLCGCWTGLQ